MMEEDNMFSHDIRSFWENLKSIWNSVGLNERDQQDKIAHISKSITYYLRQIEKKENEFKDKLFKSIQEKSRKLYHLTSDLKIENVAEPSTDSSLIEYEKYLKEKVVTLEQEVNKRADSLKSLQKRERELCNTLVELAAETPIEAIPSLETLQYLQRRISSLEVERDHRERTFRSLRASILSRMEELRLKPSTNLERGLISNVDDLVTLSQHNIQEMKRLSGKLQLQVNELKEKEDKLRNQIRLLWDRLSINEEKRHFFLLHLSESIADNIPKLEAELKDLEELKHQNLGRFINQLKRELEEWWEKCYVSEDEKENFLPYVSEEYSESKLEEHEKEVQRLKDWYSQNEDLFLKIQKWQMLWGKVTELEEKANNPARLFANRGCALLQEEKERKRINNELPRVENDLQRRIEQWEVEKGQPFLVCGQTLTNFVKSQWEQFNEKKNREKKIRQTARSRELETDSRLGTATKGAQKKRHMMRPDTLRTSKYLRTNESERKPSTASASTFASSLSRANSRTNLASPKRPQRNITLTKTSSQATNHITLNSSEISSLPSYNKFTEGIHRLSERENIRSSAVPINNHSVYKSPRNHPSVLKGPKGLPKTPLNSTKMSRFNSPATPSTARRQPLTPNANRYTSQMRSATPKVPSTLPRRRSARLNVSKSYATPARSTLSPGIRSFKCGTGNSTRLTTPIRNRLQFLM